MLVGLWYYGVVQLLFSNLYLQERTMKKLQQIVMILVVVGCNFAWGISV